jgi:hypothetical protein
VNKTNLTDTVSENALHRYSILFSGVRWVKGNFTLATAGPKCVAEKSKKEK